ncbi:LacI family DNA-binding transcriptional regulator [Curtobacterium sp. 22159]|uniref:LacI family DNA-binding transcriptional regulator n=1 Tax=Curtobacterium sp. 22159 TaxID=3453882 RepID=UPI003F85A172
MSHPATVADVALAAGVSRQTVSNVLNRPEVVRPATLSRVQAAIEDLGYRPHASARRLRTRQSSTLGVRLEPVHGISGAVLDRFLHALVDSADARGMRILLFTATDVADELAHIERLVEGSDVDGFVLTSTFHDDPRPGWLADREVPFVLFGRPWGQPEDRIETLPWVDVDGRAGLHEATAHLAAAGHRRIGFLGWPSPSGQGDERRHGWQDALAEAGLATEDPVALVCEDDVAAATRTVARAVAEGAAVDALVCASDTLALGARFALGASVPVVGYDDTPVAEALAISSVEQPLAAAAGAALELLMGSGRSVLPGPTGHHLLTPRVVWREDVGVRPVTDR